MLSRDAHKAAWSKPGRPDRNKVLEDHGYCCCFCGLTSRVEMDVHHLNGDHRDFDATNLRPICPFCHASFHLGFTAMAREAVMVMAPDVDQWRLNRLALALYAAEQSDTTLSQPAAETLNSIRARSADVISVFGTDNPYELGRAFLSLPHGARQQLYPHLSALRLFPLPRLRQQDRNRFNEVLSRFVNAPGGTFAEMPVAQWAAYAREKETAYAAGSR